MKFRLQVLLRYIPFLLLIPTIILDIMIPDKISIHKTTDNIISILLPMIFTILVIAISLPDKDIYGVRINEFRRYRVDNHFGFLEMIIVSIVIFIVHTIFSYFNYNLSIIVTYCISIIYAFLFVFQEVPVILENEKYLERCIKKIFQKSNNLVIKSGLEGKENKKFKILKKFLFTQGYDSVFKAIKTSDEKYNQDLLSNLLTINIDFLRTIEENKDFFVNASPEKIDGIEIIEAVSMSIANLESLLDMESDYSITKIYKDGDYHYWITKLIFALQSVTNSLGMQEMFKNHMYAIHRQLLSYTDYDNKGEIAENFVYKVLDNLMVYSISENEMWFLELMRDSSYNSQFFYGSKKSHFMLIAFYLFYLINDDRRVTVYLKGELEKFMSSNSTGLNSDGVSWKRLVAFQMEHNSISELIMILPEILKEHRICDFPFSWYYPPNRNSWCSSEGNFSSDYIINLWLEVVVYSINSYDYRSGDINKMFEKLTMKEKSSLINEVSKYVKESELIDFNQEHSVLSYYNCREYKEMPYRKSDLINDLLNIRQDYLSEKTDEAYRDIKIADEEFIELFEKLKAGFMNSATKNVFYSNEVSLKRKNLRYFATLCETKYKDSFVDMYIKNFDSMISKFINDEIVCNISIHKEQMSEVIKKSVIKRLKKFKYKNRRDYIWSKYSLSNEEKDVLNAIQHIDVFLQGNYYWKDKAIQFNVELENDKCSVRKLTSDEINKLIDNDYKIKDGLYKYSEYNDEKSSFYMTREKLYSLLEKRYFYIRLVFNSKIKIDTEKIMLIVKDDED